MGNLGSRAGIPSPLPGQGGVNTTRGFPCGPVQPRQGRVTMVPVPPFWARLRYTSGMPRPSLTPDQRAQRDALWAAVRGQRPDEALALIAQGAPVVGSRGTKSLLARALEMDTPVVAQAMLEAGAPASSPAHHGSIALLALERGWWSLMPALVRAGWDPTARLSASLQVNAAGWLAMRQDAVGLQALVDVGCSPALGEPEHPSRPGGRSALEIWLESEAVRRFTRRGRARSEGTDDAREASLALLLAHPPAPDAHALRDGAAAMLAIRFGHAPEDFADLADRFKVSAWSTPRAHAVVGCWLLNNGWTNAGMAWFSADVLRGVAFGDLGPRAPYQQNPVGCLLSRMPTERGPRRQARLLAQLRRLLDDGCPTDTLVNETPLWIWACTRQDVPDGALEALLARQGDLTRPLTGGDAQQTGNGDLRFWQGFAPVHYLARHGSPAALRALLRQAPAQRDVRDPEGLPPLLRVVHPTSRLTGMQSTATVLPSLEAFWAAGSDWRDTDTRGNTLVHTLARAAGHGIHAIDFDAVFLALLQRCPDLLDARNHEGQTGLNAVLEQSSMARRDPVVALLAQRRLDQVFPAAPRSPTATARRF